MPRPAPWILRRISRGRRSDCGCSSHVGATQTDDRGQGGQEAGVQAGDGVGAQGLIWIFQGEP